MNALCELATTEADSLLLKWLSVQSLVGKKLRGGMESKISVQRKGKSKRPLEGQVKLSKRFQSLHESRKRHICTRLALTIRPVIRSEDEIMTLKNLKMLNGFHHQTLQQKMKKSLLQAISCIPMQESMTWTA